MTEAGDRVGALIVAAGTSSRMGGIDKVFAQLDKEPLLARVVSVFQDCRAVDDVIIVLARRSNRIPLMTPD